MTSICVSPCVCVCVCLRERDIEMSTQYVRIKERGEAVLFITQERFSYSFCKYILTFNAIYTNTQIGMYIFLQDMKKCIEETFKGSHTRVFTLTQNTRPTYLIQILAWLSKNNTKKWYNIHFLFVCYHCDLVVGLLLFS